jgi:hypothetical protein
VVGAQKDRCGKLCCWQGPDLPQAGQRFAPGIVNIESVPNPPDESLGPLGGPRERRIDKIPDRLDVERLEEMARFDVGNILIGMVPEKFLTGDGTAQAA